MSVKISIIIPTYNEENTVSDCIHSLLSQTIKDYEIILVDDGSTDKTLNVLSEFKIQNSKFKILRQNHRGPGSARNLGAKSAKGAILVFVDSDMEFEKNFIEKLVGPIKKGQVIGTFSKKEYLLNKENKWARFWNINLGRSPEKMHEDNYPDTQEVFRAILKSEFDKAGGFDGGIGYTDDWSISSKLKVKAVNAPGAVCFHKNPDNLKQVWIQARWFGKNEFLTKNLIRKMYNLIRYNIIFSIVKGLYLSLKILDFNFLVFKITYDSAVSTSVLLSFFGEQKNK